MLTTAIAYCAVCQEDSTVLIRDCDSCYEQQVHCEHLRCTACGSDL